tara:strand:- start:215 stop:562 length:348 start_codon:yes stop_codon:yes gene_type:complete
MIAEGRSATMTRRKGKKRGAKEEGERRRSKRVQRRRGVRAARERGALTNPRECFLSGTWRWFAAAQPSDPSLRATSSSSDHVATAPLGFDTTLSIPFAVRETMVNVYAVPSVAKS